MREKEGRAGGARNPNPGPKSCSNLSIRGGASGSDRVGGFGGGAAMNEKASVSKELNAKHKKVRLLLPAPSFFLRSGPRVDASVDERIEGESVFVRG